MKKVSHRKRRNTINMYIGTGQVPRIHEELITQQEKNSVKKKKETGGLWTDTSQGRYLDGQ